MGSEFGGHDHSRIAHLDPRALARTTYSHLRPSSLEPRCICVCVRVCACVRVCIWLSDRVSDLCVLVVHGAVVVGQRRAALTRTCIHVT